MVATVLLSEIRYEGAHRNAVWRGRVVDDAENFAKFMQGPVRDRVDDSESNDEFAAEVRGLGTTGMATEFVERLLRAAPNREGYEVGEALAECVVSQDDKREISWPWNTVRDRRTPRASLPGADLVGFCRQDKVVLLLFGEIKSSSDSDIPPNVMYGSGGMTWQLEENATRLDVQHTLLKWLRSRCTSKQHVKLYRAAVQRYVASQGKEILLVGILLRDTRPAEKDVKNRAKALAKKLASPTQIEIVAWYLPVPIGKWASLLHGSAP
ncbi:MAG: hypothetical protein AB1733_24635 [Thermodesulfobacteriota bacterium]